MASMMILLVEVYQIPKTCGCVGVCYTGCVREHAAAGCKINLPDGANHMISSFETNCASDGTASDPARRAGRQYVDGLS
jgi:hypothetical protein